MIGGPPVPLPPAFGYAQGPQLIPANVQHVNPFLVRSPLPAVAPPNHVPPVAIPAQLPQVPQTHVPIEHAVLLAALLNHYQNMLPARPAAAPLSFHQRAPLNGAY